MATMTITTNNVPRDVIEWYELTPKELAEFDYLNLAALKDGRDSASFFRYRGEVYDLGEFETTSLEGWDGQQTDSFFSATLVRFVENFERVVVGRMYT